MSELVRRVRDSSRARDRLAGLGPAHDILLMPSGFIRAMRASPALNGLAAACLVLAATAAPSRAETICVREADSGTLRFSNVEPSRNCPRKIVIPDRASVAPAGPARPIKELQRDIDKSVVRYSSEFGVPANFVRAVILAESAGDPGAISKKGAQGLMQLMPRTARRMGVRDAMDPDQNIRGGVRYLAILLKRYDGDTRLTLAAYNAGEGAVDRFGGIPPYRETRNYVRKVLRYANAGTPLQVRPGAAGSRALPKAVPVRVVRTGSGALILEN